MSLSSRPLLVQSIVSQRAVGAILLALSLLLSPAAFSNSSLYTQTTVGTPLHLDVPYVPTRHEVVRRMLEMADVKPSDYLIDLGSGDGRIVVAAVRDWNVERALGIDLDPQRVKEANENAKKAGVTDRVTFEQGDLFEKDFSKANVLTMYLLQTVNQRLRPVILDRMAPGTRIVSHAFDMGDWEADEFDRVDGASVYLWIVPAKVDGRWKIKTKDGDEIQLLLTQRYQKIEGNATGKSAAQDLTNTKLRGDEISFTIGSDRYVGKVNNGKITAVEEGDNVRGWHAQRI